MKFKKDMERDGIKMLNKILKFSEIMFNIIMSMAISMIVLLMIYTLFFVLFITPVTFVIPLPLIIRVLVFIIIIVMWGLQTFIFYKELYITKITK